MNTSFKTRLNAARLIGTRTLIISKVVEKAIRFTGYEMQYINFGGIGCECCCCGFTRYAWFTVMQRDVEIRIRAKHGTRTKVAVISLADPELRQKITKFIVDNNMPLMRYRRYIIPLVLFYMQKWLTATVSLLLGPLID